MQVDTRYQKNVRGARIASNELTEVFGLENQLENGYYMVCGKKVTG